MQQKRYRRAAHPSSAVVWVLDFTTEACRAWRCLEEAAVVVTPLTSSVNFCSGRVSRLQFPDPENRCLSLKFARLRYRKYKELTHHCSPSLTVTQHYSPTLTITHHYSPTLTITHHHSPLLTVIHHPSPSLTITHYHSTSLTNTHYHSPSFIITHDFSPSLTITHHHSQSLTITHHHSPSLLRYRVLLSSPVPVTPAFLCHSQVAHAIAG